MTSFGVIQEQLEPASHEMMQFNVALKEYLSYSNHGAVAVTCTVVQPIIRQEAFCPFMLLAEIKSDNKFGLSYHVK